jgi:hypothetical protein
VSEKSLINEGNNTQMANDMRKNYLSDTENPAEYRYERLWLTSQKSDLGIDDVVKFRLEKCPLLEVCPCMQQ